METTTVGVAPVSWTAWHVSLGLLWLVEQNAGPRREHLERRNVGKRRAIISKLGDTWGYLSKAGPLVGERKLIHCLCERTSIILPDDVVVDCNDREITLMGFGLARAAAAGSDQERCGDGQ